MRVIAIALTVLALAVPAAADEAADKAAAARLFQEGRDAMAAGKLDEACARFEASLGLDPAIGTKLNLADCLEKRGKLVAAHRLFEEAAVEGAKAGKEGREDFARQRATTLVLKLVRLELRFTDAAPAGTVVRIEGADVDPATWKQARFVMPGRIKVEVVVPGAEPIEVTVDGKPGETATATIPALNRAPAAGGGSDAGGAGGGGRSIGVAPGGGPTDTGPVSPRRSRTLSYIVGGGGVALLGTSLALGFVARGKFRDAECGTNAEPDLAPGLCTPAGQRDADSARTLADVGTGVAVAGLVAVGVGVYLFVRAGRDPGGDRDAVVVAPAVSDGTVGVVVSFYR
jgi:hypothetical protein